MVKSKTSHLHSRWEVFDALIQLNHTKTRDIRSDILTQEPRVSQVEIEMKPVPGRGCLMVHLTYTVLGGRRKDSMAVPFYTQ